MGNFVKHTSCNQCGSSDGLAVYEDSSCHCFGDLTVLKEDVAQDERHYKLSLCRCNLCGNESLYRNSYLRSGRVKRCKDCNKSQKVKKSQCVVCSKTLENREMSNSKVFGGYICKSCKSTETLVKCKDCDTLVDVSTGKHSGYCEHHWNTHRIAYNLASGTKYRASKGNMLYDLDIDWVKERLSTCEVTGIKFELRNVKVKQSKGNYIDRSPLSPSIDKINPSLGYTKENCRVVIWWYNLCKATWSDDDVSKIIKQWINNEGYNGKFC